MLPPVALRSLVALLSIVVLAGCCHCSDARLPEHPQRPGDVVRELRDAIGDRQWLAAADCFAPEVRSEAMKDGSYEWPIQPRDVLVAVDVKGESAVATIDPAQGAPRELVLKKTGDRWHITSWR